MLHRFLLMPMKVLTSNFAKRVRTGLLHSIRQMLTNGASSTRKDGMLSMAGYMTTVFAEIDIPDGFGFSNDYLPE